jgi:hypothetical protein
MSNEAEQELQQDDYDYDDYEEFDQSHSLILKQQPGPKQHPSNPDHTTQADHDPQEPHPQCFWTPIPVLRSTKNTAPGLREARITFHCGAGSE